YFPPIRTCNLGVSVAPFSVKIHWTKPNGPWVRIFERRRTAPAPLLPLPSPPPASAFPDAPPPDPAASSSDSSDDSSPRSCIPKRITDPGVRRRLPQTAAL
ncbi:hypothetical protein Vafri_19003, partial [Volvox africanus]